MTFCIGCGHQIHETSFSCSQCGAVNQRAVAQHTVAMAAAGTLWLPVLALVCGLLSTLSLFSAAPWTPDQAVGVCLFAAVALLLGGAALARQKRGHDLSIAAVVLGLISLLGALGALTALLL
ncbi:hypothetical protein [Simplicispira psychrophila]|uniref:hypothetical protein n=1 Tax=Simplicispira psychrophila TaxID=80882 RepID=UPI0004892CC7|nr:hypothetical protein [Simplicispira psychrophila]